MTSSRHPKAYAYVWKPANLGKIQRSHTTSERRGDWINVYSLSNVTVYQRANDGAFGCEGGHLWFLIRHVQALVWGMGWDHPRWQPGVNPPRPSGDWGVLRGPLGPQTSSRGKTGQPPCQRREKSQPRARQKNSQRAPPDRVFALLCDLSRNVTRDSNVTQLRNVTREGNVG